MTDPTRSSRIPGFYKLSVEDRLDHIQRFANLSDADIDALRGHDPERLEQASRMIENVGGLFHLPMGFAANFRIDDADWLIPMVIEEPSVVAASSHAAKLLRTGAGIVTETTAPLMIGQIQLCDVTNLQASVQAIQAESDALIQLANDGQPRLLARGGGARRIDVRTFEETEVGPMLVVHLLVDVCDAMGANLVNGMVEALAARTEELTGGVACLRILSNLADERLARATGRVPISALAHPKLGYTGEQVATRLVQASVFAEVDPYRATTHNKGIMNGVDAFLLATGQDWRAMEAGAHAYAARDAHYSALATWRVEGDELVGRITLPIQVGTVGGVTKVHPAVKVALKVLGNQRAAMVGRIAAAVGLAQNLAAILALATEGIQRGHMSLHARNIAAAVGARNSEIDAVVAEMIRRKTFTHAAAESIFAEGKAETLPSNQPMSLAEIIQIRRKYWPEAEHIIAKISPRTERAGSLTDMLWYQMDTGGKRLRAVIPLAVYAAMGRPMQEATPLAAAVELLHNATLVHFDAENATRTRRGQDTLWVKYGLSQAIHCGAGLHYAALRCLDHLTLPLSDVRRLNTMVVTHMHRMIQAQAEVMRQRSEPALELQDLLALARVHTGGLFSVAIAGAATLAGGSAEHIHTLESIGGHLGVLFKVQDELLDIVGGKKPGRGVSIVEGQTGVLIAYALEKAIPEAQAEMRALLHLAPAQTHADHVARGIEILRTSGAIAFGTELIEQHQSEVNALATSVQIPELQRLLAGISQIFLAPVLARVSQ